MKTILTSILKENKTLVLASKSLRRKQLLKLLNLPFTTQASKSAEIFNDNETPQNIVQMLALQKANDVSEDHPHSLIIGADTIVVLDDEIVGKPNDKQHAKKMLAKLKERTHRVLTGTALVKTDENGNITREQTFFEETVVTFGKITSRQINQYLKTEEFMDKAGAYGIQDKWGAIFVKKIEGDYYNVVGLPLHSLYFNLQQFAPEWIKHNF